MKKLLGIILLSLMCNGNAFADTPLMKILDIYSNKIDNLNKDQHLFYSTELAEASKQIKKFGIPCFRSVLVQKDNYNQSIDCLNFKLLLGYDSKEWQQYLEKIGFIAKKNRELLTNDKWVNEWNSEKFDIYGDNFQEFVSNIAIMNELIELVTE